MTALIGGLYILVAVVTFVPLSIAVMRNFQEEFDGTLDEAIMAAMLSAIGAAMWPPAPPRPAGTSPDGAVVTAETCLPSMPAYLLRELAAKQAECVRLAAMELAATNVMCGLVESFCTCALPTGHDGPHECGEAGCEGSWAFAPDGTFVAVRFPMPMAW